MSPKVFVSHASEDKERFVLAFSRKLRERGIDAWVDKWEMLPGDSLVDKIFEEGIKQASAVIVILSKNSEKKPWVVEELNAGYVKRINEKSKLIPILIEDCDVPECLRSTLWVRINNLDDYDTELDSIVASIFGANEKPPIGIPPHYASQFPNYSIPGSHSNIDNAIIKMSCDEAMKSGSYFIDPEKLFFENGKSIFPENELLDSINYLGEYGFFELTHYIDQKIPGCKVSNSGFELYARSSINDYAAKCESVISSIINKQLKSGDQIAEDISEPIFLVGHILDTLASGSLIKLSKFIGGEVRINLVSSSLKRRLKN